MPTSNLQSRRQVFFFVMRAFVVFVVEVAHFLEKTDLGDFNLDADTITGLSPVNTVVSIVVERIFKPDCGALDIGVNGVIAELNPLEGSEYRSGTVTIKACASSLDSSG